MWVLVCVQAEATLFPLHPRHSASSPNQHSASSVPFMPYICSSPSSLSLSFSVKPPTMSDDVFMEILARLPLKSLFRFKCVSRAWRRLISDDYFLRRLPLLTSAVFYHCNADAKEARFACTAGGGDLQECGLEFFPFHRDSDIVDCCSGLLLSYSRLRATFYVVSPITKRWVALPQTLKSTHLAVLAFDPCHSSEYRVISFTGWIAQGSELEVFSSATGDWAQHSLHWGVDSDTMTATLRYFAGILYVVAFPNYIVAIDLDGMRCRRIELPEPIKPEGSIDKSGGFLHYTCSDGGRLKVWMLEDADGGEWVLKHSIEVATILRQVPVKTRQQLQLLALHPEREVVYLRAPGRLVSYDLEKKEAEVVCEFRKEKEGVYLVQIWLFPFSGHMSHCLAH
nr:PREDICTED: F-box protein At5g07610-like [Musa acuminata subsp. malaccensis]